MLTDRDRTALELAAATYKCAAVRERHAREQLDLTPVAFWATVNTLLDNPEAEAEMPTVVRRLRRLRERRAEARSYSRAR